MSSASGSRDGSRSSQQAQAGPASTATGGAAGDDNALNVLSESFDAGRALREPNARIAAQLPLPRDRAIFNAARPLNHIAACNSVLTAPFRPLRSATAVAIAVSQTKPAQVQRHAGRRRPLPSGGQVDVYASAAVPAHGEARHGVKRARRSAADTAAAPMSAGGRVTHAAAARQQPPSSGRIKGVLPAMMDKCGAMGPLSTLGKAVAFRRRVCITVRKRHRVDAKIVAGLVAFDKHVNLVLRDATVHDVGGSTTFLPLTLVRGENVVIVSLDP